MTQRDRDRDRDTKRQREREGQRETERQRDRERQTGLWRKALPCKVDTPNRAHKGHNNRQR